MWNLDFCFITFGAGEGPSSFLENASFWPWPVASRGYLPPSKRESEGSFLLSFFQIKWRSINIDWCFFSYFIVPLCGCSPQKFYVRTERYDELFYDPIQNHHAIIRHGTQEFTSETLKFEVNPELDKLSFSSTAIFSNSLVNKISSMWAEKLVAETVGDFQGK